MTSRVCRPSAVAEESEIGREVERVEIAVGATEQFLGDAHLVESRDLHFRRQQGPQLGQPSLGVEGGEKKRVEVAASRNRCYRLREKTKKRCSEACPILHIGGREAHSSQVVHLGQGGHGTIRIVETDRPCRGQAVEKPLDLGQREGMAQRLEQREAAPERIEGHNVERHGGEPDRGLRRRPAATSP